MTDRTWYGNAKFKQTGKWTALFPAAIHVYIGGVIIFWGLVLLTIVAVMDESGPEDFFPPMAIVALLIMIVGYVWLMIGTVSYRIRSFSYLASNKVLDGRIRFTAQPVAGTVIKRAIIGYLKLGFVIGIPALIAIVLFSLANPATVGETDERLLVLAGLLVLMMILGILALSGALRMIWVAQPIVAHLVQSVTITNAEALDAIRQRAADVGVDAEGFADALDVGGSI